MGVYQKTILLKSGLHNKYFTINFVLLQKAIFAEHYWTTASNFQQQFNEKCINSDTVNCLGNSYSQASQSVYSKNVWSKSEKNKVEDNI